MKIIITNRDSIFSDDYGNKTRLSEKGLFVTPIGDIYILNTKYDSEEKQAGAIVHGVFEYLVIYKKNIKNKILCKIIHYIASILEIIVSLGKNYEK